MRPNLGEDSWGARSERWAPPRLVGKRIGTGVLNRKAAKQPGYPKIKAANTKPRKHEGTLRRDEQDEQDADWIIEHRQIPVPFHPRLARIQAAPVKWHAQVRRRQGIAGNPAIPPKNQRLFFPILMNPQDGIRITRIFWPQKSAKGAKTLTILRLLRFFAANTFVSDATALSVDYPPQKAAFVRVHVVECIVFKFKST